MVVAVQGYDASSLSYEQQCERCETQIENMTKIWRQRVTPRTEMQTGLHVWVLTSGMDDHYLAQDECHGAQPVDIVSSAPSTALRYLYQVYIGPEKFLAITWTLSPHNMDLFIGDTSDYEEFYCLSRHEVE